MLIKAILNSPGDFEKSLRQRRAFSVGLLAVGVVGLVCYFLLVPSSALPDFAQGFYLGAATGILAGALLLLIRTQYLLTHPQQRQAAQIKEQDEREVAIKHRAFLGAGIITFFTSAAALFVILPLSMAAFQALLGGMALYALSFLLCLCYYAHRL